MRARRRLAGMLKSPILFCTNFHDCAGIVAGVHQFKEMLEDESEEVFVSKKNRLGTLYKMITLLLGMKMAQHEYKVMGLAPYASKYEIEKAYEAAFKNIPYLNNQSG